MLFIIKCNLKGIVVVSMYAIFQIDFELQATPNCSIRIQELKNNWRHH